MIKRFCFSRHDDKTTNVSLYYLRAQIIREGREGLEHVEALMRLRGMDPDAVHVPPKRVVAFKNGEFKRAILAALREGPRTAQELADMFANRLAHVDNANRRMRVLGCLRRLEGLGVVERDGDVWSPSGSRSEGV